jgi:predicted lactoylglutathione lyase
MGLNLQIATRHIFNGLRDSYEEFYQAVHRSNRVGSTRKLNVHIPICAIERAMVDTVLKKAKRVEADAAEQERLFKGSMFGGITHHAA